MWKVKIAKNEDSPKKEVTQNQEVTITSTNISTPTTTTQDLIDNEIILPSNIKPEILEIDDSKIVIKQAKKWYYIKGVDENCDDNWECKINDNLWDEIQLCIKIWENKEICSKKIKINKNVSYKKEGKNIKIIEKSDDEDKETQTKDETEMVLNDITPWNSITDLNLDWAFEMTIKVDEVPKEKQYLLFANNWDFRLFFGKWEICFDSDLFDINPFCKSVINKEIKISRDSEWNILLYWEDAWRKVSGDIEEFKVWWVWLPILDMDSSNKIDIIIQ